MAHGAEVLVDRYDGYDLRRIKKVKCAGKALQAVLVRRVLLLIGWRDRAAVRIVLAELGERDLVQDGSLRELAAKHRQQQRLHHQGIDRDDAYQLAPERPSRMRLV